MKIITMDTAEQQARDTDEGIVRAKKIECLYCNGSGRIYDKKIGYNFVCSMCNGKGYTLEEVH